MTGLALSLALGAFQASTEEIAPSFRWANKLDWPYMLLGYGLTVEFLVGGFGLTIFILYLPAGLSGVADKVGDAITSLWRGRRQVARS